MTTTLILPTIRFKPELHWLLDSLANQLKPNDFVTVIVVRPVKAKFQYLYRGQILVREVEMKPTVWAGRHRLTKQDHWSKANAINTGLCLAQTDWVCLVDDRSVLMPHWVDCLRMAINSKEPYVLAARYEKRHSMTVENGVIQNAGIVTGVDNRFEYCQAHYTPAHKLKPPFEAPEGWTYGCTLAMPLEWALTVGGSDEICDGLGGEDSIMGVLLANNGYPLKYEPRMLMVEDRTPELCGPVAVKEDRGISPNDYSHKVLADAKGRKTAAHGFDIRSLRKDALEGKAWPKPWGPERHPWDQQSLKEL